jgi:hypothetical protein
MAHQKKKEKVRVSSMGLKGLYWKSGIVWWKCLVSLWNKVSMYASLTACLGIRMRTEKHQRQEYHTWHKDPKSWSPYTIDNNIKAIRNSLSFKCMQEPSPFVCVTCYSFGDSSLERDSVQHCILFRSIIRISSHCNSVLLMFINHSTTCFGHRRASSGVRRQNCHTALILVTCSSV